MSHLLGGPSAPAPPPPPPAAPLLSNASIMEQAASERETLATADGAGEDGTDVTGGQGAKAPSTTAAPKTLLGS